MELKIKSNGSSELSDMRLALSRIIEGHTDTFFNPNSFSYKLRAFMDPRVDFQAFMIIRDPLKTL